MKKKIIILISTLVLIAIILINFFKSDLPKTKKIEENTKTEEILPDSNNSKSLDDYQENITKTEYKTKSVSSKNSSESNLGVNHIILILSLTLSLICVIVTYLVYRWKRILIKEKPNALVPEEWKKSLDGYKLALIGLKDAIINFNGYCTGEIISPNGLLLTNHHCGYDAIQNHSLGENDYLGDGFWAKNYEEEIPNEGFFVKFLIRMDDVSKEVLDSIDYSTEESARSALIKERISKIKEREIEGTNYEAEIKPFFGGNEYYLFIYERYDDVRLVGAPPESIGKYGGDTDNWMWPRHTGDFSMFRIYSDKDNNPAAFAEDNIPYTPKHSLPISTAGVKQGDYAMILGYPGSTDRYLTSLGVQQAVQIEQPARVKIRRKKLDLMEEEMNKSQKTRIQYASKHARVSNYWKYFIGQSEQLVNNNVQQKKEVIESSFSYVPSCLSSSRVLIPAVIASGLPLKVPAW